MDGCLMFNREAAFDMLPASATCASMSRSRSLICRSTRPAGALGIGCIYIAIGKLGLPAISGTNTVWQERLALRYNRQRGDPMLKAWTWVSVLLVTIFATPAWAEPWPDRPIRIIVAFPAGGVVDVVARVVMDQVGSQLGQPVVIEN